MIQDFYLCIIAKLKQMSRPQVVKKIWEHVKANDLQKPDDKRQILCDETLRAIFKQDSVHMVSH